MSGKEFFKDVLNTYFIVVTLVVVSTFLLGMIFQPDQQFGYEAFLSPLIYGFFGVLPMLIMYSKKELSIKQILVRKVIQLIVLEGILLFVGFYASGLTIKNLPTLTGFALSVFIIYILVHVISFILDYNQASKMNESLKELQSEAGSIEVM